MLGNDADTCWRIFQILFDGGRGNDHSFTIIRCR
ncbi:hypothetical protein LTSEWAN_3625, partial [Salmonella enterica subsp. enterica serovar Wandsworth str. A4-580]